MGTPQPSVGTTQPLSGNNTTISEIATISNENKIALSGNVRALNEHTTAPGGNKTVLNENKTALICVQSPQTTTFEEKGESKWNRAEVLLFTSLTPYSWAKPAQ